jgi:hypothetical protein
MSGCERRRRYGGGAAAVIRAPCFGFSRPWTTQSPGRLARIGTQRAPWNGNGAGRIPQPAERRR